MSVSASALPVIVELVTLTVPAKKDCPPGASRSGVSTNVLSVPVVIVVPPDCVTVSPARSVRLVTELMFAWIRMSLSLCRIRLAFGWVIAAWTATWPESLVPMIAFWVNSRSSSASDSSTAAAASVTLPRMMLRLADAPVMVIEPMPVVVIPNPLRSGRGRR